MVSPNTIDIFQPRALFSHEIQKKGQEMDEVQEMMNEENRTMFKNK